MAAQTRPWSPQTLTRAGILHGYPALVRTLGGDPQALMRVFGLTPDGDLTDTFPMADLVGLLALTAAELDCPDFGLRLGAEQDVTILGPIALAARHADSVADAIDCLRRYAPYHSPGLTMGLERSPDQACMTIAYDDSVSGEGGRHLVELSFIIAINWLRTLTQTPGTDWEMRFAHTSPLDEAHYRARFGCAVFLQCGPDALTLPDALLDRPLGSASAVLREAAERSVRNLIRKHPLDLGRQVAGIIDRHLSIGECTLKAIAQQMGMPPHQLQRGLLAQGRAYEDILDSLRRRRLEQLLPSAVPLTEVAFLVGYENPSSLTRACHRWFGRSPRTLRTELRAPVS